MRPPEKQAADQRQVVDPATLAAEHFDPHLHGTFYVDPKSAVLNDRTREMMAARRAAEGQPELTDPVALELVEVTRYPALEKLEGGFSHRPRAPFALLFRGSHDEPLISSMYKISHEGLGELQLFLSPVQVSLQYPVESHPDGRYYESTFN